MNKATLNNNFENKLLGEIKQTGVTTLAQHWQARRSSWFSEQAMQWFDLSGGLSLSNAKTDVDLLILAERAPNDQLFGLVYGKLIDGLAMRGQPILTPAHPIRFLAQSDPMEMLYNTIFEKAHALELKSEALDEAFFDHPALLAQSRAPLDELETLARTAPDGFILGQITSWVLTGHRLLRPHLYPQALSSLGMADIRGDILNSYCMPQARVA